MFGVRIHGRGGQGVVTAAELLAVAVFEEGGHAQAFPSFGSERTGAPVASFCRIDERPIRTHEPIALPDAVIVADPTLVHQVDVLAGLSPQGYLLVNSARPLAELGITGPDGHTVVVPATDLAMRHVGRAVPGTALLGAFSALTGRVGLDAIATALRHRFPEAVAERNVAAASEAFDLTKESAASGRSEAESAVKRPDPMVRRVSA